MKTQPRTIIQTTKYNASCNHCVTLEDDYCVPFLKSKFLTSHYVTYFICQQIQLFLENMTL